MEVIFLSSIVTETLKKYFFFVLSFTCTNYKLALVYLISLETHML